MGAPMVTSDRHRWGHWYHVGNVWRRECHVKHRDLAGLACAMVEERAEPPGTGESFRAFAYAHLGPASGWQTGLADMLNVSPRTVRRWCAHGPPPWVYSAIPAAVDRWRSDAIGDLSEI